MTRVEFFNQNGRINGFCCAGHSGYAEEGSDIVCAAVSTAVKFAEHALHLSTPGDMRSHIMPCKQGLSDVWFRFYPSLVNGMSKAIGIDGSA